VKQTFIMRNVSLIHLIFVYFSFTVTSLGGNKTLLESGSLDIDLEDSLAISQSEH